MKKIIAFFVLLFLVAGSTTIITAQLEADDLPVIIPVENEDIESSYGGFESQECEFPVMTDIPPKSEYGLSLIETDPEPPMSFDNLPSQFSWKNYGGNWMTPVKQQQCGDCWDFSALGGLEAAINIGSGYPDLDIDLSEQYVLACLSAAGSCSGGWMSEAIAYIYSDDPGPTGNGINGCTIESCMPYQGVDYIPCSDKCEDWDYITDPPQPDNKLWEVKAFGVSAFSEDNPNDWDIMKTWIFTYGPIIVDIVAGGAFGSWGYSHHSPNDVYENDDPGITDHGVVLCGWVDDPGILNGGYWILKNSWGTSWGYGGYANIAYGCNSLGTRDVTWVTATEWPGEKRGPGPGGYDMHVFADFDYESGYPHPGEEIQFTDTSDGDVALREWDLDGDGVIDSNKKRPTWTFYEEGEYEVTLTVHSEWGLHSNRTKIVEVKENWPPEINRLPEEVVIHGLSYHFDARYCDDPDGNIVSYHWDFGDGTTSDEKYLYHTFPEPDTIYEVTLTLTDNEGATDSATCELKIDQTVPPETTIHHGIGSYGSDWYKETQRISFSATDWTEVIDTFYRIDGGNWKRYVPEDQKYIPIGSEGEHTVEAYSVDYYGNEEDPVSDNFWIDKTDPTLDVTITGAEQQNGWYTSPVTVKLTGDDELSGLSKIMYQMDLYSWKTYTGPITVGEGSHYVNALAVDIAGNSKEKSTQINVDTSAPQSRCIFDGQGSDNKFYKTVEIKIIASDKGSGVKETYYKIDDAPGGFNVYYQPITVDTLGKHTIEYYSVDNIGNQGETESSSFTISNVNFDLSITEPGNGLYIFGIKILPFRKPVLIGSGSIKVSIEAFTAEEANVDYVDFLVDGTVIKTIPDSPYIWDIDERLFGSHTIEAVAYTSDNETVTDSIQGVFFIF